MKRSLPSKRRTLSAVLSDRATNAPLSRYLLLCVIIASIFTFFTYRGLGYGNQKEHLPIIMRAMDPDFLANDFFTNASDGAIARSFYANVIGFLAGTEQNLPITFILLTLCTNIALTIVSFFFGRYLFLNSSPKGLLAAVLVMSISTFKLGGGSHFLLTKSLIPSAIAMPLLTGGIYLTARKKLAAGMLVSGIGSLFHPLFGLEVCGLLFAGYLGTTLLMHRKLEKSHWKQLLISTAILILFAAPALIIQFSQEKIDTEQFIYILAHYRNPHHYIPSRFRTKDFLAMIAFCCALILTWLRMKTRMDHFSAAYILLLVALIGFACIGGYVFVELIPTRIWVIAQVFRLLGIVKWMGLCLFAGMILDEGIPLSTRLIHLFSLGNPFATAGFTALNELHQRWKRSPRSQSFFLIIALPVVVLLLLPTERSMLGQTLIFTGGSLILAFSILYLPDTTVGKIIPAVLVTAILLLTLINGLPRTGNSLEVSGNEIAAYVQEYTPDGSIFLTPPDWGDFRLAARRSIVVDFKAFLFTDQAMEEWYARMLACYGTTEETGFAMIPALQQNYRSMTDEKLRDLKQAYGIEFAILYAETNSALKTLYQNEEFKLVVVD